MPVLVQLYFTVTQATVGRSQRQNNKSLSPKLPSLAAGYNNTSNNQTCFPHTARARLPPTLSHSQDAISRKPTPIGSLPDRQVSQCLAEVTSMNSFHKASELNYILTVTSITWTGSLQYKIWNTQPETDFTRQKNKTLSVKLMSAQLKYNGVSVCVCVRASVTFTTLLISCTDQRALYGHVAPPETFSSRSTQ